MIYRRGEVIEEEITERYQERDTARCYVTGVVTDGTGESHVLYDSTTGRESRGWHC